MAAFLLNLLPQFTAGWSAAPMRCSSTALATGSAQSAQARSLRRGRRLAHPVRLIRSGARMAAVRRRGAPLHVLRQLRQRPPLTTGDRGRRDQVDRRPGALHRNDVRRRPDPGRPPRVQRRRRELDRIDGRDAAEGRLEPATVQHAQGVDERSAHSEPDAPAWSLGSPGGGAGSREVGARYLRGTWKVDQGHQLVRQVAVVLAWQATRYAICSRCAGIGCRRIAPGPCQGFKLFGGGPLQLAAAPRAVIMMVTCAGMTFLEPDIPGMG